MGSGALEMLTPTRKNAWNWIENITLLSGMYSYTTQNVGTRTDQKMFENMFKTIWNVELITDFLKLNGCGQLWSLAIQNRGGFVISVC